MPDLHQFGFFKYHRVVITNLPKALQPVFTALTYTTTPRADCDLHVVFALDLLTLKQALPKIGQGLWLAPKGMVYLLYPIATSQHYVGLANAVIISALNVDHSGAIGTTGLQLIRARQFDADFMLLEAQRAPQAKPNTAVRIANYDAKVPQLQTRLNHKAPQLDQAFSALTPRQQRDWARYIFSPKRPVTQNSHFDQMQLVLQAGFATLAQYRMGQS